MFNLYRSYVFGCFIELGSNPAKEGLEITGSMILGYGGRGFLLYRVLYIFGMFRRFQILVVLGSFGFTEIGRNFGICIVSDVFGMIELLGED